MERRGGCCGSGSVAHPPPCLFFSCQALYGNSWKLKGLCNVTVWSTSGEHGRRKLRKGDLEPNYGLLWMPGERFLDLILK